MDRKTEQLLPPVLYVVLTCKTFPDVILIYELGSVRRI